MRLIVACTLFIVALAGNQAIAQVVTSPNAVTTKSSNASIKFENTSHSFGNIIEGQIARYDFKFVNTGTEPLILSNVSASCGCTTPKYTKGQVLAPGGHASVVLGFNGSASGAFSKVATLFFSGNLTKQVSFHGEGVPQ
jgi:hypothetical protein